MSRIVPELPLRYLDLCLTDLVRCTCFWSASLASFRCPFFCAQLANIYSTEFVVETADGKAGKRYRQVFRNNMQEKVTVAFRGSSFSFRY